MQKPRFIPTGSRNGRAVLDESQVRRLRRDAARGIALDQLAEGYGIHVRTVKDVVAGVTWCHVSDHEEEDDSGPVHSKG